MTGLARDINRLFSDLVDALLAGEDFDSAPDILGDGPLPVAGIDGAGTLAGGDGDETYIIAPNSG